MSASTPRWAGAWAERWPVMPTMIRWARLSLTPCPINWLAGCNLGCAYCDQPEARRPEGGRAVSARALARRVRAMGFEAIEAPVFSEQRLRNERVIQHDPEKFAQVVKTLCYLHRYHKKESASFSLPPSRYDPAIGFPRMGYLCDHWEEARHRVAGMDIPDAVINRMEGVPKENQREEGVRICVETIERLKELNGVRGVHIMAIEWEEAVAGIVEKAGLFPRPALGEG